MRKVKLTCYLSIFLALSPLKAFSQTYYWETGFDRPKFSSPTAACQEFYSGPAINKSWRYKRNAPDVVTPTFVTYRCFAETVDKGLEGSHAWARRFGDSCPTGLTYNSARGTCDCSDGREGVNRNGSGQCGITPQDQGSVPPNKSCPGQFAGNPVNLITGNKYQEFVGFQSPTNPLLKFSYFYNSGDGLWRSSYSARLQIEGAEQAISLDDGRTIYFSASSTPGDVKYTTDGRLEVTASGWLLTATTGLDYRFNAQGQLEEVSNQVEKLTISRSGQQETIADDQGNSIEITRDASNRVTHLTAPTLQVSYALDASGKLLSISKSGNSQVTQTVIHYDSPVAADLMTGLTDEAGVNFANWSYDAQRRVITSEHFGGAEKVSLAYNTDDSTVVTNEYGRNTTYRYGIVGGVRGITAIEGAPTANCPYSNATYTYNAQGLLASVRNNKGFTTVFTYNERGQEISRLEAGGTAQARTITTEWHPTLYLKTKVTEPSRITTYQYDAQGRPLGQTVTPR